MNYQQEALKKQLMESYLRQQQQQQQQPQRPPASFSQHQQQQQVQSSALVQVSNDEDVPDNISLEEFREYVRKWLELDNNIKKAQEVIRERKKVRDKLSMLISGFMCKYNIEDLNTKEGRIRCKVRTVRSPVNQKVVKQKITDYFSNDEDKKADILSKIYEEREKVEKVSLRRLKIS